MPSDDHLAEPIPVEVAERLKNSIKDNALIQFCKFRSNYSASKPPNEDGVMGTSDPGTYGLRPQQLLELCKRTIAGVNVDLGTRFSLTIATSGKWTYGETKRKLYLDCLNQMKGAVQLYLKGVAAK